MVCLIVCAMPSAAEVRVGVKIGVSFASQKASGELYHGINRPVRKGFALGAVCETSLSSVLWLRAEPMYVQKGSEVDWPSDHDISDNTYELDYLVLPVHIKASMDYGIISPVVFTGPYLGYALSGQYVLKSDGSIIDANEKKIDFGWDFGGGAIIRLNDDLYITIDARYSLGVIDTDDYEGSSFMNRGTIVLAGVLFEL
jgi:hypothetical protein